MASYHGEGPEFLFTQDVFEDIAVEEMKHAEKIAERLFYFDVSPTTKPKPIAVGGSTEQMLKANERPKRRRSRCIRTSSNRQCRWKMRPRGCSSRKF